MFCLDSNFSLRSWITLVWTRSFTAEWKTMDLSCLVCVKFVLVVEILFKVHLVGSLFFGKVDSGPQDSFGLHYRARNRSHVVRKLGHDEVVERFVAERRIRHVRNGKKPFFSPFFLLNDFEISYAGWMAVRELHPEWEIDLKVLCSWISFCFFFFLKKNRCWKWNSFVELSSMLLLPLMLWKSASPFLIWSNWHPCATQSPIPRWKKFISSFLPSLIADCRDSIV
jgi:hypothetical protein